MAEEYISDNLIETIQESVATDVLEINGHQYVTQQVYLPPEPRKKEMIPAMKVNTLGGVVDFLSSNVDGLIHGEIIVHVASPTVVNVQSKANLVEEGRREFYLQAQYESVFNAAFRYSQYYDRETFNIALQTLFVDTPDRARALALVGNLKQQKVKDFSDDGISQEVVSRKGVASVAEVAVTNPFVLRPMRTFSEVKQPESPFILRFKSEDDEKVPQCGLFEADGGAWKVDAIRGISEYLSQQIGSELFEVAIIA